LIFEKCPNCSGPLTFFNFSCGSEIEQEYLCLSCRYCSYTFNNHNDIVKKIISLLSNNTRFYVTCNNDFIYNWNPDYKNDNTTLIKQGPTIEQIQQELNKNYVLKLDNIIGFDDIKHLMRQVINVKNIKKKVNMLIGGYPGTAKTVFLLSAKDELEAQGLLCHYIDCANLTGPGIMDYILTIYVNKKQKIDVLLLDEIDKVDIEHQRSFLNMLATGIVKSTKKTDQRETIVSMKTIATANDLENIYKALFDRFMCVYVPKYSKDQFFYIGETVLKKKYGYSEQIAKLMTLRLWDLDLGSLRRIDDLALLLKDEIGDQVKTEQLDIIINTLKNRKLVFNTNKHK
jgi:hypothetical protein